MDADRGFRSQTSETPCLYDPFAPGAQAQMAPISAARMRSFLNVIRMLLDARCLRGECRSDARSMTAYRSFSPPDFHRHPEMTQTRSGFFPFTVRLLARDGGRSGLCPGVSPPTPPTETRENDGKAICERFGAGRGNRTPDPEITNHVLYQLSYTGAFVGRRRPAPPLRPVLGSAAVIWIGRHARWLR